jgi:hypothetical protein
MPSPDSLSTLQPRMVRTVQTHPSRVVGFPEIVLVDRAR